MIYEDTRIMHDELAARMALLLKSYQGISRELSGAEEMTIEVLGQAIETILYLQNIVAEQKERLQEQGETIQSNKNQFAKWRSNTLSQINKLLLRWQRQQTMLARLGQQVVDADLKGQKTVRIAELMAGAGKPAIVNQAGGDGR